MGLRAPSLQSRINNLLAFGLMGVLGLGSLTWYYAHAMRRAAHARDSAAVQRPATGDLPPPSLGHVGPSGSGGFTLPASTAAADAGIAPPAGTLMEVPVVSAAPATYGGLPGKTPAEIATERELSGVAFAAPGGAVAAISPSPVTPNGGSTGMTGGDNGSGGRDLSGYLRPSFTATSHAQALQTQRLLLPKGAFIDCTLETAIDSTLPGMTTCVMASDAFGVDGRVVLLERGTKLIGETRGQVQQGAARVFVLWTEARTPSGVLVPLDSPGADELGRAGLAGTVDTHFWQRFGAAMLVSVIDGAVQAAVQSPHGGAGTVVVNPSGSQEVLTEILKNTINVPPTVFKRNGDRVQVLVARDIDFRTVYELHTVSGR